MITESPQPIAIGSRLGQFVIRRALGAGGMGEVYEAEDTRLHRHVALKVVRREVASDPVRRTRLEREASAVAMLNHPHIVTVHSLEEHDDVLFITMELVEGSSLAAALPARGFPLDRLLSLSIQLADALSAAHAVGIVHGDLKPANIMMTRDGTVKVLDFGLSRLAFDQDAGTATPDVLTADGGLMGTAAYMSPERIEGHVADARSDLFSLGVVLFEVATGQRPFGGRTPLVALTSIAKDTPPLASETNPGVPEDLARVIDRCLVKDPARRMQSAVDLRGQLEDLGRMLEADGWRAPAPRRAASRRRLLAATNTLSLGRRTRTAAAVSIGGLVLAGVFWLGFGFETGPVADRRVTRFTVDIPVDSEIVPEFNAHLALSPDGTQLAFTPLPGPVFIRQVDSLETRSLDASLSPGFRGAPLFSPDSTVLSFIQGNAIFSWSRPFYRTALSGGAAVKLADYDAFHRGDWAPDGWIYWTAQYPGGIVRIPDTGGDIEPVTELDLQRGERSHRFASLLPGGQALMYTVASDGINSYDDARIDLSDLRTRERKTLITGGTSAAYSPSGHIVYARAGKLLAVAFDPSRRELTGEPFEVLDGVLMSSNTGAAEFSLSRRGDLAYVPGASASGRRTLVWVDRSGKTEPLPLPPAPYLYPRLSSDGRYLAVEIEGPNHDFYVYDFARSVLTKMTTDGQSHDPVWAPDGRRLAFRSWIAGGMTMWMMPADRSASAMRLDPSGTRQSPVSISPDGKFLAFDQKDTQTRDDVWVLPLDDSRPPQPVARSRFGEGSAKFSPDGRWIAYASDESGTGEVYVQPFPGPGPKIQVSNDGGFDPVWRRAGGELYYRSGRQMMAVSITSSPDIRVSPPRRLWEGDYSAGLGSSCGMPGVTSSNYDITPDGQRFLMVRDDDSKLSATRIVVVLNWAEELRGRARSQSLTARTTKVN
jgi:serine/threonine protein kinase/dipeptidyl aminopeptidase/acylaminoacyl peptidase